MHALEGRKPTPADLRAEIARLGLPVYVVSAHAKIHPASLSLVLRGHRPLSDDIAQRVLDALQLLAGKARVSDER